MGKSRQVDFEVFRPRKYDAFDPRAHEPARKVLHGYLDTHWTFGLAKEDGRWAIFHLPTGLRCGVMRDHATGMAVLDILDRAHEFLRDVLQGETPQWGLAPGHGYGGKILGIYENDNLVFDNFSGCFEFTISSNFMKKKMGYKRKH